MKKELFAAGTILLLITASVWNTLHLKRMTSELSQHVSNAQIACESEDFTLASTELQTAFQKWNNSTNYIHSIIYPEAVDAVSGGFYSAICEVTTLDKLEARIELYRLSDLLSELLAIESVTFRSIF